MIRLEMKNCNTVLIEKQLKYQPYHLTYSPLGKAFEKQIKTIEDQEEKQIKLIPDQGKVKAMLSQCLMNRSAQFVEVLYYSEFS